MMTTTPPAFDRSDAVRFAAEHYGLDTRARPLVSERDQNFLLETETGKRCTLKISNHAEQEQVIDFQNRALLHVASEDASLPVPRVIPTLNGQLHCAVRDGEKNHFVRMLSWLEGSVLNDITADSDLACRLGRLLARLGLALKAFEHPGSNPPLLWDMKRATGLRELLVHIEDPEIKQLATRVLDRFDTHIKPRLDTLRAQVIHNDMNLGNVLMDKARPDRIIGLIDFGDMVKSPLIIDLAVAAAYRLSDTDEPLCSALPMIAGYHAVRPLQDMEMELLPDLIKTRLITSLLINSYRVKLFPENREYLMISYDSARSCLVRLNRQSEDKALQQVRSACVAT